MDKRLLLALLLILGFQLLKAQQESQFTQFFYNQQVINPAYSGLKNTPELYALFRKQWIGYPGSPQSMILAYNGPFLADNAGFGFLLSKQSIGITKSWTGNLSYAYQFSLGEKSAFRIGIQGSMQQWEMDFSSPEILPLQSNDPVLMESLPSSQYLLNWGTGAYFLHSRFYLGISIPSILPLAIRVNLPSRENLGEIAKLSRHYYFISGYIGAISEQIDLKASILAKYVKNAPVDLDIHSSLLFQKKISAGLSYRFGGLGNGESIDLLLFYYLKQLELGISYDLSTSPLTNSSSGSFEVISRYHFKGRKNQKSSPPIYFLL